jgi:PPK2 family polyphosphate:nucleotide phosphotransferase
MRIDTESFSPKLGKHVDLRDWPTLVPPLFRSDSQYQEVLAEHVKGLAERQLVHYACARYAVLLILQGMDAAGKDGTIRHILSGVGPEGCEVFSFKQPSAEELRHDFLWRTTRRLPERGRIGVFNRSYYEEVLIVRVHPATLLGENLPAELRESPNLWKDRYRSIVDLERHLYRNGTRIIKIFLHLSKREQRKRFLARIDTPHKNWKLQAADIHERKYWKQYQAFYGEALSATNTREAPWHIVPADEERNARLIASRIVMDTFDGLKMRYPQPSAADSRELQALRRKLAR